MPPLKDLTGKRFGRLTVISRCGNTLQGRPMWTCNCDCGEIRNVKGNSLVGGSTKSCGCLNLEVKTTHGLSKDPLYNIWFLMINRCRDSSNPRYGGRGISVCNEWAEGPSAFINWALSNGYSEDLQLDRIDNDGDYCPENCRFVSASTNCANRGKSISNSSGYVGVSSNKYNRWMSKISYKGLSPLLSDSRIYLGCFNTAWEACQARNEFIKKHNLPHKIQERADEQ